MSKENIVKMSRFQHVAVLMGGISEERQQSLESGAAVVDGLREAGLNVTEIDVKSPDFDLPDFVEAVFIGNDG